MVWGFFEGQRKCSKIVVMVCELYLNQQNNSNNYMGRTLNKGRVSWNAVSKNRALDTRAFLQLTLPV